MHRLAVRCLDIVLQLSFFRYCADGDQHARARLVELRQAVAELPALPLGDDPFCGDALVAVGGISATSTHAAAFLLARHMWNCAHLTSLEISTVTKTEDQDGNPYDRVTSDVVRRAPTDVEWTPDVWRQICEELSQWPSLEEHGLAAALSLELHWARQRAGTVRAHPSEAISRIVASVAPGLEEQCFAVASAVDSTPTSSHSSGLPPYRDEEQVWFTSLPRVISVREEDLREDERCFPVVLMTAVEVERDAVLRLLKPMKSRRSVVRVYAHQETYFLGRFGAHRVVVTMCAMGATGRGASILATDTAINRWKPQAVIMPGIAFGRDATKQSLADLLIASHVIPYEAQRVDRAVTPRAPHPESGGVLLNRFRNVDWEFRRPDGSLCRRYYGPLLSGEKLVDDDPFKGELFKRHPAAIGGDMEGHGVYAAAARNKIEAIVLKAICDWGDGKKHGKHQPLAAAVSASLAYQVLSDGTSLSELLG